jgi:hypothetical protein
MSLFVFFISLLIVAQHVSGNHVPIMRCWRLRDVITSCWYVPWLREGCATNPSMDALPANRTWQPSWSHGTYQHKAIKSRSRHLLMMGKWLPEKCWTTSRRELDALTANRYWQPSHSHGTYQHKAITSRSRQLLMMGTWLPETCWATCRREVEAQPAHRSWQPFRSHGTYQNMAKKPHAFVGSWWWSQVSPKHVEELVE